MRVKKKWFKDEKPRSLEDNAGVIAFHCWQIAVERIKAMEGEGFFINLPEATIAVISEYMAFLIHITDRRSYTLLEPSQREKFMSAMANKLIDILEDNCRDAKTAFVNRQTLVTLFNKRFGNYAEMPFDGDHPSYSMYRYLGHNIAQSLGQEHQKWVVERVIDVEAPAAVELLKRTLGRFL